MTDKQIEEKALEAYPEEFVWTKCDENSETYTEKDSDGIKWLKVDKNKTYREGYIKALKKVGTEPKIKGWVARDKKWFDEENRLTFFFTKPERHTSILALSEGWWNAKSDEHCSEGFRIDKNLFPELTWEDEPIEVELLIRKI